MAAGDPGLVYHTTARHACTCNWSVQRRTRPCTSGRRAQDSRARVVHRRGRLSMLDRFWIVPVENRVLTARETLEYGIVLPKRKARSWQAHMGAAEGAGRCRLRGRRCGDHLVLRWDGRREPAGGCRGPGGWRRGCGVGTTAQAASLC